MSGPSFPSFSEAGGLPGSTKGNEYGFDTGVVAGDPLLLTWERNGDSLIDDCATLEVVGLNARYERQ